MDTKNPNKNHRSTPEYAEYQRENFWGVNEGKPAPFNTGKSFVHIGLLQWLTASTDPGALEELAREKLSNGGWSV